ncbi:hypothetical protein AMK19_32605 [Kitasatospora sp. CB01950]|nr:hypothetical protein AMK19_32605 [Kitasatospora sp. CB01950]
MPRTRPAEGDLAQRVQPSGVEQRDQPAAAGGLVADGPVPVAGRVPDGDRAPASTAWAAHRASVLKQLPSHRSWTVTRYSCSSSTIASK